MKKDDRSASCRRTRSYREKDAGASRILETIALRMPIWTACAAVLFSSIMAANHDWSSETHIQSLVLACTGIPMALGLVFGVLNISFDRHILLPASAAALTVVSSFFTVSPGATLHRGINIAIASVIGMAILSSRDRASSIRFSFIAMMAAGMSATGFALMEYRARALAGEASWRVFSVFFNPGFFSGFLVLAIFATLAVLICSRGFPMMLAAGVSAAMQIGTLPLTGARAGIMAFGAGLLVFLLLSISSRQLKRNSAMALAAALTFSIGIAVFSARPTASRVENSAGQAHSLEFRKLTWKATADMAQARPLTGFGPGTYELAINPYLIAGYTRMAHSNYLQIAAESGIPTAILIFGSLFSLMIIGIVKIWTTRASDDLSVYATGAISALTATSVRGLFDSDWWNLPILLSVGVFFASLISAIQTTNTIPAKLRQQRALGTGLLMILSAALVISRLTSIALEAARTASGLEDSDYRQARELYAKAARLAPWLTKPRVRLALYKAMDTQSGAALPENIYSEYLSLTRLEPTNQRIPRSFAEAYVRSGESARALKLIRRARELDPKSPGLMRQEAEMLEKMGRKAEAERVWRKMLDVERSPYGQVLAMPEMVEASYAWAHAAIGDIARERGKRAEAVSEWKSALSITDSFLKSVDQYGQILILAGITGKNEISEAVQLKMTLKRKLALQTR